MEKLIKRQIKFAKKGTKVLGVDIVAPVLLGEGWNKLSKELKDAYTRLYDSNPQIFDDLYYNKKKEEYSKAINYPSLSTLVKESDSLPETTEIIEPKAEVKLKSKTSADKTPMEKFKKSRKTTKRSTQRRAKSYSNDWGARAMAEIYAMLNFSLGDVLSYNISNGTPVGEVLTKQVNLKRELMKKEGTLGTELDGGSTFNFSEIPAYEIDELDQDGNLKVSENVSYKKKSSKDKKSAEKDNSKKVVERTDSVPSVQVDSVPTKINPFEVIGTVGNHKVMGTYSSDSVPLYSHILLNGKDSVPVSTDGFLMAMDSSYTGTRPYNGFTYSTLNRMYRYKPMFTQVVVDANYGDSATNYAHPEFYIEGAYPSVEGYKFKSFPRNSKLYYLEDENGLFIINDIWYRNSDNTFNKLSKKRLPFGSNSTYKGDTNSEYAYIHKQLDGDYFITPENNFTPTKYTTKKIRLSDRILKGKDGNLYYIDTKGGKTKLEPVYNLFYRINGYTYRLKDSEGNNLLYSPSERKLVYEDS